MPLQPVDCQRLSKTLCFGLRKIVFWRLKDSVLQCERLSFGTPLTVRRKICKKFCAVSFIPRFVLCRLQNGFLLSKNEIKFKKIVRIAKIFLSLQQLFERAL